MHIHTITSVQVRAGKLNIFAKSGETKAKSKSFRKNLISIEAVGSGTLLVGKLPVQKRSLTRDR